MAPESVRRRNGRVALSLGMIVAGMVGMSFAAVPLYDLFCRVTGFSGTTQVAAEGASTVLDRDIQVRFNADTSPDLAWSFQPVQRTFDVKVGEEVLGYYKAKNVGSRPLVGTATYNVTPLNAGRYFSKIECFCFTEQRLEPGESIEMPVTFFVDPAIADDPHMNDVRTITLSYTFFPAKDVDGDRVRETAKLAN